MGQTAELCERSWSFQSSKVSFSFFLSAKKNAVQSTQHAAKKVKQSIHVHVHTCTNGKKKRAIVYYYVRIYTTANVSADTVEGDQQLLLLGQKAVKPTGKTTLVQFLFFFDAKENMISFSGRRMAAEARTGAAPPAGGAGGAAKRARREQRGATSARDQRGAIT